MSTRVMIDGEIVAPDRAVISVFDRGFLYGDSVFETIRTYGGVPYALGEHLDRLEQSARLVLIDLPVPKSVLAEEVLLAVRAADNPESYVRVMVTRGTGELGLDPGSAKDPRRILIVAPLSPPPPEAYERGIVAITYQTQRVGEATSAVGAKVGNYLVAALAMREARAHGAEEALITDANRTVVEGATSNVFFVNGGRLGTPPVDSGILPGITRAKILEVARELGVAVELRAPTVAELLSADEVFVSSSIRELLPVVRVDEAPIGPGRPGPLTHRLLGAFRSKVM